MKEIIIRTTEPFTNESSFHYDDEDISTLGAKLVFEAIIVKNNMINSLCQLVAYDVVKHLNSTVFVRETVIEPGKQMVRFRDADLSEIESVITTLESDLRITFEDSGLKRHVEYLKRLVTKLNRDGKINEIFK